MQMPIYGIHVVICITLYFLRVIYNDKIKLAIAIHMMLLEFIRYLYLKFDVFPTYKLDLRTDIIANFKNWKKIIFEIYIIEGSSDVLSFFQVQINKLRPAAQNSFL